MTIDELIAALEQATGPSKEIDRAILTAVCPDAMITFYTVGDDEPIVLHDEPLVGHKMPVPDYTASIDAALTLVPKAYLWTCATYQSSFDVWPQYYADCAAGLEECPIAEAYAATPALALCIAALKARQVAP